MSSIEYQTENIIMTEFELTEFDVHYSRVVKNEYWLSLMFDIWESQKLALDKVDI